MTMGRPATKVIEAARSRRGTTMVEAAVVFPLVILTVITCVLICMFFYTQTMEQSRFHMALRQAAEEVDDHTEYAHRIREYDGRIETEKSGLFYRARGKERVEMKNNLLIKGRTDQTIESLWTASDGVTYVRYCTLASNIVDGR